MKLDLELILNVTDGVLVNPKDYPEISSLAIDSRRVSKDTIYWPILGEVHDGHKFIVSAIDNGAPIALCEKSYYYSHLNVLKDLQVVLVDNSTKALHRLASYFLESMDVPVIGVTGSVGKTSTKEMLYHVLKRSFKVHKNKGNLNNHVGLPLTVLDLEADHNLAILEMGMNHLKEIETLTQIAKPQIGVITNIGTSHIGILGSRENIFQAKMEMVTYFDDNNTLILNGQDEFLETVESETFKVVKSHEKHLLPMNVHMRQDGCFNFDLDLGQMITFELNVLGQHQINNALLAIGVALELQVPVEEIKEGLKEFVENSKRLEILEGKKGHIINDCYNASEESMKVAIDVLRQNSGLKIAVLGDVLELGEFSQSSHEAVGTYLSEHPVDYLMTYGKDSQYISEKAKDGIDASRISHFTDMKALIDYIESIYDETTYLLIKGSFGMNMAQIVEALKKEEE